jgi:hypothetical protein
VARSVHSVSRTGPLAAHNEFLGYAEGSSLIAKYDGLQERSPTAFKNDVLVGQLFQHNLLTMQSSDNLSSEYSDCIQRFTYWTMAAP